MTFSHRVSSFGNANEAEIKLAVAACVHTERCSAGYGIG
jgi:hypothetical protein